VERVGAAGPGAPSASPSRSSGGGRDDGLAFENDDGPGGEAAVAVTVAVKTMAEPELAGFADETSVAVVAAPPTAWTRPVELEAARLASPP